MKALFPLCFALALLTGCNKDSTPAAAPDPKAAPAPAKSSGVAPVDYLANGAKAQQTMTKTAAVVAVNTAIQLFYAENNRFPKGLDELAKSKPLSERPKP